MCLTHPTLFHLGNVLATLSDKRTGATFTPLAGGLTPGADARIDTWKPIVVSAHDYYPFGQYMPGRYSADTLSHCVATTFTGMGTVPYTVVIPPPAAGDISLYGSAVVTYLSLPTVLHMVCTTATSGLFTVLPPVSAQGTHVLVDVGAITNNHTFTVRDNTTSIILGSTSHGTSTSAGLVSIALSPVPHSTSLSLIIECTDPTGGDLYCNGIVLPRDTLTAINIHGNICSADAYQYGFNGQMKDNEWAGLGNHYTALYWEMDPRVGRRWNQDPKPNPSISNYAIFGNNPIAFSDELGDIVKATSEANEKIQEGLVATLGKDNPIGYDGKMLTIKSEFDKSKFNATQLEIVEKYDYLIRSPTDMISVEMVDQNQKISDLTTSTGEQRSLTDIEADAVTAPFTRRNEKTGEKVGTEQHIYISRNPTFTKNGVKSSKDWRPGLATIHEIGHAYLHANPAMIKISNNKDVQKFETRVRQIYNHDGMIIKGWGEPHPGDK